MPREFNFNPEETSAMTDILMELEQKGVIRMCSWKKGTWS